MLVAVADGSCRGNGGVEGWWRLLVLCLQCDKFSHTLYGNFAHEMSLCVPQSFETWEWTYLRRVFCTLLCLWSGDTLSSSLVFSLYTTNISFLPILDHIIWWDENHSFFFTCAVLAALLFSIQKKTRNSRWNLMRITIRSLAEWRLPWGLVGDKSANSLFLEAKEERSQWGTRLVGMDDIGERGGSFGAERGILGSFNAFSWIPFNIRRRQEWRLGAPGLFFFEHGAALRL